MTPLGGVAKRKQAPRPVYRTADGTRVPSVTTVLGVIAKPALTKWANRLGLQGIDSEAFVEEAAGAGTLTHMVIESTLNPEKPWARELADEFTEEERAMARIAWRRFARWHSVHEVEPLLMEHSLVSERLRVGGTVDLYARIDGVPTVVDFKTSNTVYDSHLLQLAAYRSLLEEAGHPVEQVRVVLLPREEQEEGGESVVSETEPYLAVFESAVQLYRVQQRLHQEERKRKEHERSAREKTRIEAQLERMVNMSKEELAATVASIPS